LMNSVMALFGSLKFASIPTVGAMYGLPPKFSTIRASSDALRLPVIATVNPLSDMGLFMSFQKLNRIMGNRAI
jgi:hypothetical protein